MDTFISSLADGIDAITDGVLASAGVPSTQSDLPPVNARAGNNTSEGRVSQQEKNKIGYIKQRRVRASRRVGKPSAELDRQKRETRVRVQSEQQDNSLMVFGVTLAAMFLIAMAGKPSMLGMSE